MHEVWPDTSWCPFKPAHGEQGESGGVRGSQEEVVTCPGAHRQFGGGQFEGGDDPGHLRVWTGDD